MKWQMTGKELQAQIRRMGIKDEQGAAVSYMVHNPGKVGCPAITNKKG